MSRNTNDVVDVVDKEELVVESELVVALVLRLLDVIRVLLQMLHLVVDFVRSFGMTSFLWNLLM